MPAASWPLRPGYGLATGSLGFRYGLQGFWRFLASPLPPCITNHPNEKRRPDRARPALWGVGRKSGRGGAALAGTGAGGQGDPELAELLQVETGFIGSAEPVSGDGSPVGLRGQAPNHYTGGGTGAALAGEVARSLTIEHKE